MTTGRILVVEDEAAIRDGLRDVLEHHGHDVRLAADGRLGLEAALSGDHHLALLDVMLPEVDGFTICRELRAARPSVAICMLTARGSEEDVLEGFASGADDYVAKPFSVAQLLARIEALLRRAGIDQAGTFAAGAAIVDAEALVARHAGDCAELTSRDVAVLACLARQPGRVVSRSHLLGEVWGYDRPDAVETRCVDMHVVKLRRKLAKGLGDVGEALVETVRGEGYRIACPEPA